MRKKLSFLRRLSLLLAVGGACGVCAGEEAATNAPAKGPAKAVLAGKTVDLDREGGDWSDHFGRRNRREGSGAAAATNATGRAVHAPTDLFLDLNGERLTWGAVDAQIDLLLTTSPLSLPPEATVDQVNQIIAQTRTKYASKITNLYIRNALLAQKARECGLKMSEAEMAAALTNSVKHLVKRLRAGLLAKISDPASYFYRDLENYQLTMKYREEVLKPSLTATAEEIAAARREREEDIAAAVATNATLRPRMTAWLKEIRDGSRDFGETAFDFSDCGSAGDDGVMGDFERDCDLLPELKAFVFAASTNELSEVIETPYSFHILKIVERRYDPDEDDGTIEPVDGVKAPTSVTLAQIMLEKEEIPDELDDEGARALVIKRKLGKLTAERQREALAAAKIESVFPVNLLKNNKKKNQEKK